MEVVLRSCGGVAPPDPVTEGWQHYLELPDAVQLDIWKLVVDSLAQPNESRSEERIQTICAIHEVPPEGVVPAALACQFLLAGAYGNDLNQQDFGEDLTALSGGQARGLEVILSRFDSVKAELENVEIVQTMADHGKVLENLEWRLDKVISSSRGYHRESDVIFLTLEYKEGDTPGRITLQVSPRGLAALQRFLSRFQS